MGTFIDSNIIEKKHNGFALHQRNEPLVVVVITIICLGLAFPIETILNWSEGNLDISKLLLAVGSLILSIAFAMLSLRLEWRRMIIDNDGIYLLRPLAKNKFISWENVLDWGFAYTVSRLGRTYCFYFSTVLLRTSRDLKNKKMPSTSANAVYIYIDSKDLHSLRTSGVLSFCKDQLVRNAKKFPPMFGASFL